MGERLPASAQPSPSDSELDEAVFSLKFSDSSVHEFSPIAVDEPGGLRRYAIKSELGYNCDIYLPTWTRFPSTDVHKFAPQLSLIDMQDDSGKECRIWMISTEDRRRLPRPIRPPEIYYIARICYDVAINVGYTKAVYHSDNPYQIYFVLMNEDDVKDVDEDELHDIIDGNIDYSPGTSPRELAQYYARRGLHWEADKSILKSMILAQELCFPRKVFSLQYLSLSTAALYLRGDVTSLKDAISNQAFRQLSNMCKDLKTW